MAVIPKEVKMIKEVCQNLNRYFDQELSLPRKKQFLDHLSHCPDCQKKLRFLQEIDQIGSFSFGSAPKGTWQAISSQLPCSYQFGHRWWQKVAIAACFTLFAAVGSLSGNHFYEDYDSPNLSNNSIYSYLEENL